MSCIPLDQSQFSVSPLPGFGIKAIQLPDLNIPFPSLPLDNLQDLFDAIQMILPPGLMKSSYVPGILNDVFSGINSLLEKFMPFLMLYKFFLPVLELILCIIEVLCALTNPFKIIKALRKLFRNCIPAFLNLFPAFAIILMILALILLIIALIEYIIQRLIIIIETILRNIILLSKAASSLNNDSIIAIVKKIGDLLCILQNLFILFAVFNTILQIIKAIASLSFKIPPCDSSDGDGCCTPDVCPQFIRDNEVIHSTTGTFQYLGEIGIDSGLTLPMGFPAFFSVVRPESWQFYDASLLQSQEFINITNAWDLPPDSGPIVFFPPGTNYTEQTAYTGTPYYMSFQLTYDPTVFGRSAGTRVIKIQNAVVQAPPTAGVVNWNGDSVSPTNGTLTLIGGSITELDGTPILDDDGKPFTIRTLFHQPTNNYGTIAASSDPVIFSGLTYDFTINHPILAGASLITIGCVPEVAAERDFLAATVGAQFNANGLKLAGIVALLPDMAAAQQCVIDAITTYRKKISTETTEAFRDNVLSCLNNLRTSAATAAVETVGAGYDPYQSTFFVDPAIQFTSDVIQVKVSINEASGNSMSASLPADVATTIAGNITATVSFGEVGPFTYDGSTFFVADITSPFAGNGDITVSYNNSIISVLNRPTDLTLTPSISINTATYTFVQSQILRGGDGAERRDDGDVSREE